MVMTYNPFTKKLDWFNTSIPIPFPHNVLTDMPDAVPPWVAGNPDHDIRYPRVDLWVANSLVKADFANTPLVLPVGLDALVGRSGAGVLASLGINTQEWVGRGGGNLGGQAVGIDAFIGRAGAGNLGTQGVNAQEWVGRGAGNLAGQPVGTDEFVGRDLGNLRGIAVPASRFVGRTAIGNLGPITGTQAMAILSGTALAPFSFNTQLVRSVVNPLLPQDAATKDYHDGTIFASDGTQGFMNLLHNGTFFHWEGAQPWEWDLVDPWGGGSVIPGGVGTIWNTSARITTGLGDLDIRQHVGATEFTENNNVTFGCWVKCSTNDARIAIDGTDFSPSHTGSGNWEWLTVTKNVAAAAFWCYCLVHQTIGGETADFSGAICVEGTKCPAYSPHPPEYGFTQKSASIVVCASTGVVWPGNMGQFFYICDGTADQVEIDAALAYVAAFGGGTVYLTEGIYYLTGPIQIPSNCTLMGAGPATILTIPNGHAAGFRMIDNLNAADSNIIVTNFSIDGNAAGVAAGIYYGVYFDNVDDSLIDKLWIHDLLVGSYGVCCLNSNRLNLLNCFLDACGSNGASFTICTFCAISNNFSLNNVSYGLFMTTCSDCAIAGNTLDGSAVAGAYLLNSPRCGLVRNVANGNPSGMYIAGASAGCLLAENTISGSITAGLYIYSDYITIDANIVHDNTAAFGGIYIALSDHCTINANHCYRNGGVAGNIYVSGSDYNLFTNNVCRHGGVAPRGIWISSGVENVVHGNDLYLGGTVADYTDSGTNTLERDNRVTQGWYSMPGAGLAARAARYYPASHLATQGTTGTTTVNYIYAEPFYVSLIHTYDRIAMWCVALNGGGTVRMGIYRDAAGYPGALIIDAGNQAIASPVTQTVISQVLSAGWYWLVYIFDAWPGAAPTFRRDYVNYGGWAATQEFGHSAVNNTIPPAYYGGARAFGALPNPYPAGQATVQVTTAWRIMLRG